MVSIVSIVSIIFHEKDKHTIIEFTNLNYPHNVITVYIQIVYLLLAKSSRFPLGTSLHLHCFMMFIKRLLQ